MRVETLRVQVPNNHILAQNLYYSYYYPKPKYQIIGYLDPLGYALESEQSLRGHLNMRVAVGYGVAESTQGFNIFGSRFGVCRVWGG